MGAGRSGTSMASGLLAKSGYYMGDRLIPPRKANIKGFFESKTINNVNESILSNCSPHLSFGQRWLSIVTFNREKYFLINNNMKKKIKKLVSKEPFCYKDPRFCYVLPIWRPFLKNTKFLCIFRNPKSTITSMIRSCETDKYLKNFVMTQERAKNIWEWMYKHILKHKNIGDWLFLHYNQMFNIKNLNEIEEFLNTKIDKTFPEKRLRKQVPKNIKIGKETIQIYKKLCFLAKYK
jgi:hypothetical protein